MEKNWTENLAKLYEEIQILENGKKEACENFDQFCEFIAEPAFETLEDELKKYGVKVKLKRNKRQSIAFQINFPKSRIDHFHYILDLAQDSLELKLKLRIKVRKKKTSLPLEKELPFMTEMSPPDILKLQKENLLQDIIEHYRQFVFEAHTP